MRKGPSQADVVRTLRQCIRDIDFEIALLRAKQAGLEQALSVVLGESALVAKKFND